MGATEGVYTGESAQETPTQNREYAPQKPEISYDDFVKTDIRLCLVEDVKKVEGSDKLYELSIDTGFDKRTVVSAIADRIQESDLRMKRLPFVLNLAPRKIRGIESRGMIILAEAEGELALVETNNISSKLDGAVLV